jgi:hypothetical protein
VISGVLFGADLTVAAVASKWPQLWLNPGAATPIQPGLLPVMQAEVIDDWTVEWNTPAQPPARLFGLDEAWPGPEPAFPKV